MSSRAANVLEKPATEGRTVPRPRRRLDVVFVCQAVDQDDPDLATTIRWIEELAGNPEVGRVTVLALRVGRHELPAGIEVLRFGRPAKVGRLMAFYREITRTLREPPDLFFVYQGGPYPFLLMPFKLFKRIPIVHWKANPLITRAMAFQARWCDDLVLTCTPTSFPMDLEKVRVVGHGIDTEVFRPEKRPLTGDLITACRISHRKHIEEMVAAVAHANRELGAGYRLNVYGPTLPGDVSYAARLESTIDRLGARNWVTLHGPVPQRDLPALLNGHRAFLSWFGSALDKSVVEAMASGLPVISTNDAFSEIIPADLRPDLIADKRSTERQAEAIHALLRRPRGELAAIGSRLRDLAVREHSVDRLFDRILEETRRALWEPA